MIDFRVLRRLGPFVGSVLLWACHGADATGVTAFKTLNPYARLQLNVRAAVMSTVAPYDTLQMIPTAYDANGEVLPLPGPVKYTVNDTTLKVSASGLLTLTSKPGTNAMVIVSVQDTSLNLTHKDTAFILGVTTTPTAPLASFSIQPVGADSAVLDVLGGAKTLTVTALDGNGKTIPVTSLQLHFLSENTSLATVNAKTGVVTAVYPGTVRLTASTTYYGVTKTDSLQLRIGYPDTTTETIEATPLPGGTYLYNWTLSNLVIGAGKTVIFAAPIFQNSYIQSPGVLKAGTGLPVGDRIINEGISAVFDDSAAAYTSPASALLTSGYVSNGTGNVSIQIPDSMVVVDSIRTGGNNSPGQYSVKLTKYCTGAGFPCATARSFPTPGTYHFHSATTGSTGTITVVAP